MNDGAGAFGLPLLSINGEERAVEEKQEDKTQEDKTPNQFTDNKGRTWTPRVSVRSIDIYEDRIGIGLFAAVLEIASAARQKKGKQEVKIDNKAVLEIFGRMFGSVGALGQFLYESCRGQDGKVIDHTGNDVSAADFYDAIGEAEILPACTCALNSLFEYMPNELKTTAGGSTTGPFGLGDVKTFLGSQRAPE